MAALGSSPITRVSDFFDFLNRPQWLLAPMLPDYMQWQGECHDPIRPSLLHDPVDPRLVEQLPVCLVGQQPLEALPPLHGGPIAEGPLPHKAVSIGLSQQEIGEPHRVFRTRQAV